MLQSLSIKNYALIDTLDIQFSDGLTTITGETGAGKSILLGALGLVLGKRADLSSLKDTQQKCVVEAQFNVKNYNLYDFFKENDIDYEDITIIRREILPTGKSRTFINDTPVNLTETSVVGGLLMDIHSQHQTLELSDEDFQLFVLDSMATNAPLIEKYKNNLKEYKQKFNALNQMIQEAEQLKKEQEFNQFLFDELKTAHLKAGEQAELESVFEQLNNVEIIKENIEKSIALAQDESIGIQFNLNEIRQNLQKISPFSSHFQQLFTRISSMAIEMDDVVKELFNHNEKITNDPEELALIAAKLQTIYTLQKKHKVSTVEELLHIQETLDQKLNFVTNLDDEITKRTLEINISKENLDAVAVQISENRSKVTPIFIQKIKYIIADLGLQNADFKIDIKPTEKYFSSGKDEIQLLVQTNVGSQFGLLKKVASGGELSRIMLAVKATLAEYSKLPTLIFDEIDSGVSGEIANKMGEIMMKMSQTMQIFAITHLPQIAARGMQHYKVSKTIQNNQTSSEINHLNPQERILEIAEMLSGKNPSETALEHAKSLLNGSIL